MRTSILFLIIFFTQNLLAQKIVLKGVVQEDSTLITIEYANVIAYRVGTTEILGFTETNSKGLYQLELENIKSLDIQVLAIGYTSVKRTMLDLEEGGVYENNFLLKLNEEIEVIEIKAEMPIRKVGDTTIFKASAFSNKSERTLDELIKKTPGLELSDDGSIYFKNKKIDKIFIEGDDLFQQNYQVGTKNIPAEIVENIEIIENYQSNSATKDIKKGDETILNLTLKNGIKTKFFGNISGAYGLENRREWQSNVFSLSGKSKFYLITHHNNIGFNPIELTSQKIANQTPEGNKLKEASFILNIPKNLNNTQFSNERANLNNVKFAYLGGVTKFSKRFSVNYSGFILADVNKLENLTQTQFLFGGGGSDFELLEKQNQKLHTFTLRGQLYSRYEVSPNTLIEYFSNLGQENRKNENSLSYQIDNIKPDSLLEKMTGKVKVLSQKLSLSQKIDTQKAIIADFYILGQNQREGFTLNSNRINAIIGTDSSYNLLLQNNSQSNNFWGLKVQLIGTSKKLQYAVFANLENSLNPFDASLRQENTSSQIQINSFTNNFSLRTHNYSLGKTINFKVKKIDITSRITLRKLNAFTNLNSHKETYIEPSIGFNYRFANNLIGIGNYSYSKSLPEINNLLQGNQLSNYRNMFSGTEQIIFPDAHNAFAGLIYIDISRGIFSNLLAGYIQTPNMYGLNQNQFPDLSVSESILVNNGRNIFLNLKFDKSLDFLSSTLKTDITFFRLQQPSKFFDIFDVNTNINNLKYTLLYLTNLKKIINFEIKAIYKSDAINNEIEGSGFRNRASIKSLQGKVILKDKKEKFLFLGALEYIQIKNQERKSDFYFADIESRYNIKPKSTLSIVARNVFSVGKIDLLNIYANTVVFRSQEILPQLFLMKFTQSF